MNFKGRSAAFTPWSGYLIVNKLFKTKICTKTFVLGANSYTVKTHQLCRNGNARTLNKALLDISREQIGFKCSQRFCSSTKQISLMDWEVMVKPDLFKVWKVVFLMIFVVRKIDKGFSIQGFSNNARVALEVVTRFLSEGQYSDLEGLLTNECKSEVEKNVAKLSPSERMSLAVKSENIHHAIPYDVEIIRAGEENEKLFLQVTMVYNIFENNDFVMENRFDLETMLKILGSRMTVYNCRFIKEYTKGVNDQWIINSINLYKTYF